MTPRTRARVGEGERLRDEILAAAEALLVETGRDDLVSMRAVADRVGCTPAAIYLHFADKTALIFEVCRRLFESLDAAQEEAAEKASSARGASSLDELKARGRAYVDFGIEHPEEYRILFMGRAQDVPDGFDADDLLDIGGFSGVVDAVRRSIDGGLVAPGDPFEIAARLWAVVHGITSLLISKPWFPWPDRDTLIDGLLDSQIRALAP